MKRTSILFSLCMLSGIATWAQQTITIKGTVTGSTNGYNKVYLYGEGIPGDSATIENGVFQFTIPFTKPFYPLMYAEYNLKGGRGYRPMGLLIDQPGTINLTGIDLAKQLQSGKVSGMKSAEDYSTFEEQLTKAQIEGQAKMKKDYPTYPKFNTPEAATYRTTYDSIMKTIIPGVFETFIKAHPGSYAAAFALDRMGRGQLDTDNLQKLYSLLTPKNQQTTEGKDIAAYLTGLKNSAIGKSVNDFTLNTPDEKALRFADLKGKYVLIDFWASWCGPCKASFPHMKEVYGKYKGDKFEIYSISIDKDKDAWLKESKKQDLPWLQTLDTKNVSQSGFAVTAVPTTYLVDPNGKIIMKAIGFDSSGDSPLEKKLQELFGAAKTKMTPRIQQ